jgi:hypothetical protein
MFGTQRRTHLSAVSGNYGGIPYQSLENKFEETPDIYVANTNQGHAIDTGTISGDYIRNAMKDSTPDPGFLESDAPSRAPQTSRTVLNMRFNGSRGSNAEGPRHSELFIGFMDQDNRGLDNTPRFDKMVDQMASRIKKLEPTMGDNVGTEYIEYESPVTGQAIQKRRVAMQENARHRIKVFDRSEDGRQNNSSTVAKPKRRTETRQTVAANSTDHWTGHENPHSSRGDKRPGAHNESETNRRDASNLKRGKAMAAGARTNTLTAHTKSAWANNNTPGRSKASGSKAVHEGRKPGMAAHGDAYYGRSTNVATWKIMKQAMSATGRKNSAAANRKNKFTGVGPVNTEADYTLGKGSRVTSDASAIKSTINDLVTSSTAEKASVSGRSSDSHMVKGAVSGKTQALGRRSDTTTMKNAVVESMRIATRSNDALKGRHQKIIQKTVTDTLQAATDESTAAHHAGGRGNRRAQKNGAVGGNNATRRAQHAAPTGELKTKNDTANYKGAPIVASVGAARVGLTSATGQAAAMAVNHENTNGKSGKPDQVVGGRRGDNVEARAANHRIDNTVEDTAGASRSSKPTSKPLRSDGFEHREAASERM